MRFHVLGCSGGELPHHRTTCFLVDGRLAIDAGALTSSLPLAQLLKVDDVVLTHSHFDHVKDVPLLADLLVGRRTTPVRVHASTECARTLRQSVFNGKLWPDFTRIPSARIAGAGAARLLHARRAFRAGGLRFQPVPVRHPVESVGFVVSNGAELVRHLRRHRPDHRLLEAGQRHARASRRCWSSSPSPTSCSGWPTCPATSRPRTLARELAKLRPRATCPSCSTT